MRKLQELASLVTTIATLSLITGCTDLGLMPPQAELEQVKPPPTCAELLERAEECRKSVQSTHEINLKDPKSFRKRVLESRIQEGVAITEEVLGKSEADPEQWCKARQLKAELLYLGAFNFEEEYGEQLRAFAKETLAETKGAACESVTKQWLMFRFRDPKPDEYAAAKTAVQGFAKAYPGSLASCELIGRLALQMVVAGEPRSASSFLAKSSKLITDPGKLSPVRARVNEEIKKQAVQEAKLARTKYYRDSVKRKLGGRESGYFIMFSMARKGRWCDYSVCHGLDGVVKYTKAAEHKDWRWQLEKIFPDTKDGYERAVALRNKLYKERTTIVRRY